MKGTRGHGTAVGKRVTAKKGNTCVNVSTSTHTHTHARAPALLSCRQAATMRRQEDCRQVFGMAFVASNKEGTKKKAEHAAKQGKARQSKAKQGKVKSIIIKQAEQLQFVNTHTRTPGFRGPPAAAAPTPWGHLHSAIDRLRGAHCGTCQEVLWPCPSPRGPPDCPCPPAPTGPGRRKQLRWPPRSRTKLLCCVVLRWLGCVVGQDWL